MRIYLKPAIMTFMFIIVINFYSFGQTIFPQKEINQFNNEAFNKIKHGFNAENIETISSDDGFISGAARSLENISKIKSFNSLNYSKSKSADTMYIGAVPNDSVVITGNYVYNGTIIIVNDGVLHFRNANATIFGDVILFGDNARLIADSSYLYFPQQYYYHRKLILALKGIATFNNSTLDYSGLPHHFSLMDSALIEMNNVEMKGFTTTGLDNYAHFNINGSNQAGEFVITEQSSVDISNAETVLLWHQFPDLSVIDISFPNGDTVYSYLFNDTVSGVSGIDYSIKIDTCYDVMWGMMPSTGSDVTISNSKIRSIGLWFKGHATTEVNGLVNSSNYTNFTAPLSDRTLHLVNSSVRTWSLYPMDTSTINVSGCILGEIGAMNYSTVNSNNIFVDGSGGYFFATNNAFAIAGFSAFTSNIRSEENGFAICGYSSFASGVGSAVGNSVLMVIQSYLSEDPVPYEGSCVWYAYISQPSSGYIDSVVAIKGSVWIDKTAISQLMDFGYYKMYYQAENDTVRHLIKQTTYNEVRNDTMAVWNTAGLTSGNYNIILQLFDNYNDSTEAIKSINLQPFIVGITENEMTDMKVDIFPNPFHNSTTIEVKGFENSSYSLSVYNQLGQKVKEIESIKTSAFEFSREDLNSGIYFYSIEAFDGEKQFIGKFVIQ